jgi:hypothetical protein
VGQRRCLVRRHLSWDPPARSIKKTIGLILGFSCFRCISATNSCNSSCLNSTAEDLLAACLSSGTSGAQVWGSWLKLAARQPEPMAVQPVIGWFVERCKCFACLQAIQVALASDAHSHTAYATVAAAVQGSLKDVTGIQLSISNKTHDSAQPTLHLLSWPAAASLLEVGLLEDLGLTSAEPAPYSSYLGSTVNATAAGPTAATWSIASDAGLGVQGDVLPLALAMATAPSSRQPSTQPISPAPGYLAAFPVQGPQLLALYYRADLLPGQGAPRTWADLVHLLAALNTTATSQSTGSQPGPGDLQKPAYPLCMASCNTLATGDGSVGTCQPGWCSAAHAGLAVLASLLQTHGWAGPPGTSLPAWGVAADVFRPGRVLGSAATSAALQLLESLAPYTHAPSLPAQPSKNSTVSNQQCSCDVVESFLAGSCWVALAGPDLFKASSVEEYWVQHAGTLQEQGRTQMPTCIKLWLRTCSMTASSCAGGQPPWLPAGGQAGCVGAPGKHTGAQRTAQPTRELHARHLPNSSSPPD